jgi:hypothetical protein
MVAAEPGTANFCGELLKFATAPFRAGRSLDSTVDELVEMMKLKGNQKPPSAQEQMVQVTREIEMAKINQKKESDLATLKVKQDELVQKDSHHQEEMQNQRRIAWAQIQAKLTSEETKQDANAMKMQETALTTRDNQISKEQDRAFAAEKHNMAMQVAEQRKSEMAQRSADRRTQQQFKMMQPPRPQNGGLV